MKRDLRIDFTLFDKLRDEICSTEKYLSLKNHIAHGVTNVYDHSIAVARRSYVYAVARGIKCDIKALVVGALLHDYFLYDWHKLPKFSFHGLTHAKTALGNAISDYDLSETERNIISSHMFPLNLFSPPKCKEAWIVTWQDKICAIKETFKRKDHER